MVNDGTNLSVTKVVFNSSFASARPTSNYRWFSNMVFLTSITGISYLNTSQVTNMCDMFNNCTHLTSLNVSGFSTSNVIRMDDMFAGCGRLTSLDLTSFNTENVETMYEMFYACDNLTTIYVGSEWEATYVFMSDNMFRYCENLVSGAGTTFDANHQDRAYAHIDGGTSNPGYFTAPGQAALRGDVNIADVTALIDILLSG